MSESLWNDPRITAYVLDELPEAERAEFESELAENTELACAVAEAGKVTSQLDELYADEVSPTLDPRRRDAILGTEARKVTAVDQRKSYRLPLAIMATAASLLVLLGVAPWLAERNSEVAMQQAQQSVSGIETASESDRDAMAAVVTAPTDELLLRDPEFGIEMSVEEGEVGDKMTFESGSKRSSNFARNGQSNPLAESESREISVAASQPPTPSGSGPKGESHPFGDDAIVVRSDASSRDKAIDSMRRLSASDQSSPAEASASSALGRKNRRVVQLESATADPRRTQLESKDQANLSLSEPMDQSGRAGSDQPTSEFGIVAGQPLGSSAGKKLSSMKPQKMEQVRGLSKADGVAVGGRVVLGGEVNRPARQESRDEDEGEVAPHPSSLSASVHPVPQAPAAGAAPEPAAAAAYAAPGYPTATPAPTPTSGPAMKEVTERIAGVHVAKAKSASDANTIRPREFGRGLKGFQDLQLGFQPEYGDANPEGTGPGKPGDQFEPIDENAFKRVSEHPLSTFSVDVDTASYSKTRDFLIRANQLPRPDAVRIEELVNYFDYDYEGPDADADHPFAARAAVTGCPWNEEHRLARIAIKGKEMNADQRPKCNLVFLVDTSGSMKAQNKLPLVLQGMQMLVQRLNKKDRVAIVVYAGSAGLVLDSTKVGKNGKDIKNALTRLSAGGSTNGGAGIALAYQTARDNFISDGVNRVILCTDGDFNVGVTGTDALVRMVEKEAKGGVFLSVLGFGMGNHNDAMLEKISGQGNGNYAFIDTENEARKVLVEQTNATLVTIAKDVKIQVEFNPTRVSSYRLIGYENRILAKEDFNDDKKDAGEIGAGHEVTALYEIVPAGVKADGSAPKVDPLKYQKQLKPTEAAESDEMVTVKLRYKQPDGDKSTLIEFPVIDDDGTFDEADADTRFAAAVVGLGMQLRRSSYKGDWTLRDVLSVAEDSIGEDEFGLRSEFVTLVRKAMELSGQQ